MHLTEARHCLHCPCLSQGGRCCYCQFTSGMLKAESGHSPVRLPYPILVYRDRMKNTNES